jgi:hypothetical protein
VNDRTTCRPAACTIFVLLRVRLPVLAYYLRSTHKLMHYMYNFRLKHLIYRKFVYCSSKCILNVFELPVIQQHSAGSSTHRRTGGSDRNFASDEANADQGCARPLPALPWRSIYLKLCLAHISVCHEAAGVGLSVFPYLRTALRRSRPRRPKISH